jgi:DNA-binding CsgD family transcriptional regulator
LRPSHLILNLVEDLKDLALQCRAGAEFRYASMERIARVLSFDAAVICSTTDGHTMSLHARGLDEQRLCSQLGGYLAEMTLTELRRACDGTTLRDRDVFEPRRRTELRLYRDYVGTSTEYLWRAWIHRDTFHASAFARSGPGRSHRPTDRAALDHVYAVLVLAESQAPAHASPLRPARSDRRCDPRVGLSRRYGLTSAERRAVELVQRGLTNGDVAAILGTSVHTVRNQLASVFRKVNVSSRTELLFVLGSGADGADNLLSAPGECRTAVAPWLRRLVESSGETTRAGPSFTGRARVRHLSSNAGSVET